VARVGQAHHGGMWRTCILTKDTLMEGKVAEDGGGEKTCSLSVWKGCSRSKI
jgi:hypothetical protein